MTRLLEIAARGHVDAPRAAAEINGVEIHLHDLVFAQRRVEPRSHDHFAQLALVADIVADQKVLRDLLRDGRAALWPARLRDVGDEGADQAALVDALVLIEPLVLGGDERLLDVLRNVAERHPDAAVIGLEQLGEAFSLAVIDDAGARQLEPLQLVVIGEIVDRIVVELDHLLHVEG